MPMVPFYTKFPELAVKETRTAIVKGHPDLPDGEFGFVELYCNEDGCDCRRVLIQVVSPSALDKVWATIGFGGESVGYFRQRLGGSRDEAKRSKGPILDPLNTQTEYSPTFLNITVTASTCSSVKGVSNNILICLEVTTLLPMVRANQLPQFLSYSSVCSMSLHPSSSHLSQGPLHPPHSLPLEV